jgi:hypothetical protein
MCAARASDTAPGSGTSRSLSPFGRPNHRRPLMFLSWRTTRTRRGRKSTASTARPKISPPRRPRPAPQSTTACHREASPARSAPICAAVHGTIFRFGWRGIRTDPALHGFRVIRPSSTAAFRIVDRVIATWLAPAADMGSAVRNCWTMDGRWSSCESSTEPSPGRMCSLSWRRICSPRLESSG